MPLCAFRKNSQTIMSIETRRNLIGKTQAILMAEAESEHWISLIRLGLASAFALISLYTYAIGQIPFIPFILQIIIALGIVFYSSPFISRASKRYIVKGYSVYILTFLDVTAVTAIIFSYLLSGAQVEEINRAVFAIYFIAIAFTGLHHKVRLSLFGGVLAALELTLLYVWQAVTTGGLIQGWSPTYLLSVMVLLIVGVLSGLTSRNNFKSIQKVSNSEVRYHNLVHRLPQMLFTLNAQGDFLWANMASYAILGIPSKIIHGRNIRDFIIQPEQFRLDPFGTRGTFQVSDFNGTVKFVDMNIQPVDEKDSPVGWDGSMVDVTDRELAIGQREEMANRFFQYQKMESLGTLASGMAHDFNNILQTVNDLTERVSVQTGEEETKKQMKLISETLVDAKFLVSELFALGRKKPLDYSTIEIISFLRETIPLLTEQLGSSYSVNLNTAEDALFVQADPNYLKRIFQNFFGNARDAMPQGGSITIDCFAVRKQGEANNVVIRFSDTGTGIPEVLQEKIFDPFFTTKKPGKGTGLGLALVRRIITLHNGQVSIENSDAEGTTFRIEIPESDRGDLDIDTKSVMLNRIKTTILILDDDPKIRDILRFFLNELKYEVLEASTCEQGENALRDHIDDCRVLIMDWRLGNENPHTVVEKLRALKGDLIVFVVSGYPPLEKSINELKIYRWFTKPYDKSRLDLEIQKALYLAKKRHLKFNR